MWCLFQIIQNVIDHGPLQWRHSSVQYGCTDWHEFAISVLECVSIYYTLCRIFIFHFFIFYILYCLFYIIYSTIIYVLVKHLFSKVRSWYFHFNLTRWIHFLFASFWFRTFHASWTPWAFRRRTYLWLQWIFAFWWSKLFYFLLWNPQLCAE